MKLYFFTNRISKPLTGGELYNEALINGAVKAGYTVVNSEAIRLGKFKNNIFFCNLWYILKVFSSKSTDIIVVDTDLHARCFLSVFLAKTVFRRKLVGMLHHYNYWDKESAVIRKIHFTLESWISKCFDFLITNSNYSYKNFLAISHNNIPYVILNPFIKNQLANQLQHFNHCPLENKKLQLLHIGSIEHRKNLHTTIKALGSIAIDFHFDIIGNFTNNRYHELLVKLIEQYSLQDKITFHGYVSEETINNFISNADIFIIVSLMEGYGMAYAEVMIYGLPIIASNCGAIPELVKNGINGYLCEPDDYLSIKNAILKLTDINNRKTIRKNNIEKGKCFLNREQFVNESCMIFDKIKTGQF